MIGVGIESEMTNAWAIKTESRALLNPTNFCQEGQNIFCSSLK